MFFAFSFLWLYIFILYFRAQRLQHSDTVRCIKNCQPNDVACIRDPTVSVSHTFISLPTFREFTKPEGRYQLKQDSKLFGTNKFEDLIYFISLNLLSAHIHFPAAVTINMTSSDPNYLFHDVLDGLGWTTQVPRCMDRSNHTNPMQTVTADKHILPSMQFMYPTHSSSTLEKLGSCHVS